MAAWEPAVAGTVTLQLPVRPWHERLGVPGCASLSSEPLVFFQKGGKPVIRNFWVAPLQQCSFTLGPSPLVRNMGTTTETRLKLLTAMRTLVMGVEKSHDG